MRIAHLRPLGRLDRYVAALFLMSYATAILLVVGFAVVVDVASHLKYFEPREDGSSVSGATLFQYYVLSLPFFFAQGAPFVTVMAGMFTVARLVRQNELTAGLCAGVSAQRLLAPVFLGALAAAGLTFAIRQYASETVGPRRDALYDQLENERPRIVLEDFMFRDRGGNVVRLGEYHPAGRTGPAPEGERLEATLTRRGVVVRVRAERMQWVDDGERRGWRLQGGQVAEAGDESQVKPAEWLEEVEFTPQDVLTAHKARERVLELSFSQVLDLSRRDPDNTSYQTLVQYHLTFPLANVVLLLCAVPFLVGRERGKAVEGVTGGLLLCVGFFCMDFVTRSLGLAGDLSPLMAAWLPVLFFGALGISLTHFMRT
jgi:lipopolysaccharide export system permease protein